MKIRCIKEKFAYGLQISFVFVSPRSGETPFSNGGFAVKEEVWVCLWVVSNSTRLQGDQKQARMELEVQAGVQTKGHGS